MKKLFALAIGALVLMGAGCMSSATTTSNGVNGSITTSPVSGSANAY